jgi:hypothetical protein
MASGRRTVRTVLLVAVACALIAPGAARSETTETLRSLLQLKRTPRYCSPYIEPHCSSQYVGPSAGPDLQHTKFHSATCYGLCTQNWSIGADGGPDWIYGEHEYGGVSPHVGTTALRIRNGTGIYEGATGTGTLTCRKLRRQLRSHPWVCLLELQVTFL